MGNFCQCCLKEQIKEHQFSSTQQLNNVNKTHTRFQTNQLLNNNVYFNIQPMNTQKFQADSFIIFVDNPNAIMQNRFISSMGISSKHILREKIQQEVNKYKMDNNQSQFIINIDNPFYQVPIRKLVISQFKVWDGIIKQKNYLKNRIQNTLNSEVKYSGKKSIAIAEIQSYLGYNLADFQTALISKLRQLSNNGQLARVIYLTDKESQITRLKQSINSSIASNSLSSISEQKSNYY